MSSDGIVEIGADRQLFVDDSLIGGSQGVERVLHSPARKGVAVAAEHPWERVISAFFLTLHDGEKSRMYYLCSAEPEQGWYHCAYAESDDGIEWRKPNLGIIEFGGSKENNLVYGGPHTEFAPFLDANPDVRPDERYKAFVVSDFEGRVGKPALVPLASPDGLQWRPLSDGPMLTDGPFDSHNLPFWDTWRGEYVLYARGRGTRSHTRAPDTYVSDPQQGPVRWIRRATSPDFRHWTPLVDIDCGDAPFEHLYTNACTPYERAPGTYLMFPSRFVQYRMPDNEVARQASAGSGVNDIVLMSSRDGLHFDRSFLEAFIRPGLDVENWRERGIYAGRGLVQTSPSELSIYAREHRYQPTVHIRRYALRTDGFVSMHAGYGGGELITEPFIFSGRSLALNYSTSAVGSVQVEVQDAEGHPQAGFGLDDCPEMFADEIEGMVTWEDHPDLSVLAGQPVRLRFRLVDADLYALKFND
ncbi:MAG: hypothetical protein CL878_10735 [Dehalococcoidia bacterium]|nr:hypothetical protein [Dehalococcoidia bacterium]